MMGILLSGYDLKKGFCLKRNFIYKIRETALKDAYPIIGNSIKMTPTIFYFVIASKRCYEGRV
ncbi:hypothetical protein N207_07890 [Helicobacter pylori UM114]|uniref:Uncharacterized protein n=1 Tax=Helicobacter pylori UM114 TaxID=1355531 RepID=T0ETT8_HELPX|nr:hypothetical protein N207_07890 [Helicobacter pylori UM114]